VGRWWTWAEGVALRLKFNRQYAKHHGTLVLTTQGIRLERYSIQGRMIALSPVWSFRWREVQAIHAFNSVDLICLAFDLPDGVVEVDEEMEGYHSLMTELSDQFPSIDAGWWKKVAHPAFATNWTTLWTTESSSARSGCGA
jgi:hypothetical protein